MEKLRAHACAAKDVVMILWNLCSAAAQGTHKRGGLLC
jgi:hypothetical protein